ncbi:MAG: sugar ABC transporter permease [Actinomycetaceae bacterium]|nr:sugar ABC transporter permease [Actinomycetaceae bacterium]
MNTTTSQPITWKQRLSRWEVKYSPYLYISPFFIIFAIAGLFPIIYTMWVSLHDWHLIGGQGDFVGMSNYVDILHQPRFYVALRNTFSIFILATVPQVVMAILVAYVLDANLRAKTFWRMGVLLPYVIAPVAVSMIFTKIFADQSGMANTLLTSIGLNPIAWHSDVFWSHIAIATMVNFRWMGYNALIFLAAMQAIPSELYEAATIDGAGRSRQFFSVTIPQLKATIIFVVITSTIGGLQIFDEPRMFNHQGDGGPDRQWMTLTMYLYEAGWGSQQSFGRAAAIAWLLFLIIVFIGIINFYLTQRISSSDAKRTTKTKGKALNKPLPAASATASVGATPSTDDISAEGRSS